jgi:hypothetical protein
MEKDVSHAATDEEGRVTVTLKRVADRISKFPGIHGMIMRLRSTGEKEKVGVSDW